MLENDLKSLIKKIFKVDKVTFDVPGSSSEQGTIYLEVEELKSNVGPRVQSHMLIGEASMFGRSEAFPLEFFSQQIYKANATDTKDLVFTEVGYTDKVYRNIVRRTFRFVYFFSGQYDPAQDKISSIDFKEITT